MAKQYDNTNSGALFKNDRKENERHPDYKGSLNVEGVEYWVSSWIKTGGSGVKFMSLALTPKDEKKPKNSTGRKANPRDASPEPDEIPDDDVPF